MQPSALRLHRDTTTLLIVDIQERLSAAMAPVEMERVTANVLRLCQGASALGVPLLLTEQYPRGLGPTIEPLRAALAGVPAQEKLDFSAYPVLAEALRQSGRDTVLLCGMEAHVCVFQTARDLREAGYLVQVVADAVISRSADNRAVGLGLMERCGAVTTCTEAALFDLCGRAGTPEFKRISALVK